MGKLVVEKFICTSCHQVREGLFDSDDVRGTAVCSQCIDPRAFVEGGFRAQLARALEQLKGQVADPSVVPDKQLVDLIREALRTWSSDPPDTSGFRVTEV